jgi:hypothetical protein
MSLPTHNAFELMILWWSQSGDDPQDDLTKIGYKLNYESKLFKTLIYIFGYPIEQCMKIWRFFFF